MVDIKSVSKQLRAILSDKLSLYRSNPEAESELKEVMLKAFQKNAWFTSVNIVAALEEWIFALSDENVSHWLSLYHQSIPVKVSKRIGVINAGNIPFVGMHDLLAVIFSGHNYIGKNASDDQHLLPWIAQQIISAEPAFENKISFVERLEKMDAVIATGSDNSSRYFEYYFGKYPNVIRKNRNGIAILTGNESNEELKLLGNDIFSYFGLGCRNVSKIYIPADFKLDRLFEAVYDQNEVMNNQKYMNNFDYNNSVLLLKLVPFLQNGFLIMLENEKISSPISILHYERYDNLQSLTNKLDEMKDQIQCIVCSEKTIGEEYAIKNIRVGFGQSQKPKLWDYADGIDTISFLSNV